MGQTYQPPTWTLKCDRCGREETRLDTSRNGWFEYRISYLGGGSRDFVWLLDPDCAKEVQAPLTKVLTSRD